MNTNPTYNITVRPDHEFPVDLRELHTELLSKRQFGNWAKTNLAEFKAGQDFGSFNTIVKRETGASVRIDYHVTLDVAKHIAMMERTERGRAIRQYFIEVEKSYREGHTPAIGHDMSALISVIRDLSTEVRGLREQIASSSPWPARTAPAPVPQLLLPQLSESQAAVREKVIAWTGVADSHLVARCLKSQIFWSHDFKKLSPPCSPRSLSRHLAAIEDRPIEISGGIAVVWRRARTGQARYWELEVANAA